jgi:hypothetical protein
MPKLENYRRNEIHKNPKTDTRLTMQSQWSRNTLRLVPLGVRSTIHYTPLKHLQRKKPQKPHPCFQETMQEGPVLNHSLNPDRRTYTCRKDPKCISETEAFAYLPAIPTLIKTPFPCPPVTPRACTNSYFAAADRCTLGQAFAATTELAVALCAQTRTERERERLSLSLSHNRTLARTRFSSAVSSLVRCTRLPVDHDTVCLLVSATQRPVTCGQ